jgi:hypothetical protein
MLLVILKSEEATVRSARDISTSPVAGALRLHVVVRLDQWVDADGAAQPQALRRRAHRRSATHSATATND